MEEANAWLTVHWYMYWYVDVQLDTVLTLAGPTLSTSHIIAGFIPLTVNPKPLSSFVMITSFSSDHMLSAENAGSGP